MDVTFCILFIIHFRSSLFFLFDIFFFEPSFNSFSPVFLSTYFQFILKFFDEIWNKFSLNVSCKLVIDLHNETKCNEIFDDVSNIINVG